MSFPCPQCGKESAVVDTRESVASVRKGFALRLRRECLNVRCGCKFSTLEMVATHGGKGTSGLMLVSDADVERRVKSDVSKGLRALAYRMSK